ncbi:hypothetical protein GCG54_00006273 [Colletotrichum gloeosporioides]|uniref:Uncharacterized protein n=1 Tax=Colletotrichum gloeosporioides TaxID=474922 RepID=A0A8H4CJW5_COLGL|nr:uncharacterized protein GCG54_00006273 [Colletotrichum gloeosporioides]KAF3805330.1 hypothetical protein GCG54_00006273 [Colletotrichum gloeosporioides]
MKRSLPSAMISITRHGATWPNQSIQTDSSEHRTLIITRTVGRTRESTINLPSLLVIAWATDNKEYAGVRRPAPAPTFEHYSEMKALTPQTAHRLFDFSMSCPSITAEGIIVLLLHFCWIPLPPNSRDTPGHHGLPYSTLLPFDFAPSTDFFFFTVPNHDTTHIRLGGHTHRTTQYTAFLRFFQRVSRLWERVDGFA